MRLYKYDRDPTSADRGNSPTVHPAKTDFNPEMWLNESTGKLFLPVDLAAGIWRCVSTIDTTLLRRPASELLPTFKRIYQGSEAEGTASVDGSLVASYDTTIKETGDSSLKLAYATGNRVVFVDLNTPQTVRGNIRFRMRCSDWSQLYYLRVRLYEGENHTGGYHDVLMHAVANDYTGASTYPWTADEWRTINVSCDSVFATNDPEDWGNTDATAEKTIRSIGFHVQCDIAVDFWIDRINADEWPCAFVSIVGDGCRGGFCTHVADPFYTRGWKLGLTANEVADHVNPDIGLLSRYREYAQKFDFSMHGKQANGVAFGGSDAIGTGHGDDAACAAGVRYWAEQGRAVIPEMQYPHQFLHAILQDNGSYDGVDLGGTLADLGVLASRGGMWDAGMEVPGRYDFHGPLNYNEGCTDPVPALGQYNYPYHPMDITSWDNDADKFAKAVRCRGLYSGYTHSVYPTASDYNITEDYAAAMIAAFDAAEGDVEFVTIRDLYYLTYGRTDDYYVEAQGTWRRRSDPTWIE